VSCLGVHFALTDEEVGALRSKRSSRKRLDFLQEDIEERYLAEGNETGFAAESDKAWDAMHRALADGRLSSEGGEYPLNHVVLGGEILYVRSDYIMSLKSPKQVREIAAALRSLKKAEFRQRYFALDPKIYRFPVDEDDFDYTWHWLEKVRGFYGRAAKAGRFVLFTADQ
jgi:hypothetical protein